MNIPVGQSPSSSIRFENFSQEPAILSILPEELILHILGFLKPGDARQVRRVCLTLNRCSAELLSFSAGIDFSFLISRCGHVKVKAQDSLWMDRTTASRCTTSLHQFLLERNQEEPERLKQRYQSFQLYLAYLEQHSLGPNRGSDKRLNLVIRSSLQYLKSETESVISSLSEIQEADSIVATLIQLFARKIQGVSHS